MDRFLRKISYTVLPLWLFFVLFAVWYNCFFYDTMNGDLGRLGKISMPPYVEDGFTQLYYENVYCEKELKDTVVDVITIGDSFSQQGINGYQNYIASRGVSLINYDNHIEFNKFQLFNSLMELGYIDSTNVKVVIVECAERYWEYLRDIDFKKVSIKPSLRQNASNEPKWSLLEIRNYMILHLGVVKPVRHAKLSAKLFSVGNPNRLYFYSDDLKTNSINADEGKIIKKNVEKIIRTSTSLGIKVIFLICPDKFDVYQNYIVNNPFPRKKINEDLKRYFPYHDNLIIAKDIIMPYINKGGLDYYHYNDSHWTYKSSKIVADEILIKLSCMGVHSGGMN